MNKIRYMTLEGTKDEYDLGFSLKAPKIRIQAPKIRIPSVKMPSVKMPSVKMPQLKAPKISLPKIKISTKGFEKSIDSIGKSLSTTMQKSIDLNKELITAPFKAVEQIANTGIQAVSNLLSPQQFSNQGQAQQTQSDQFAQQPQFPQQFQEPQIQTYLDNFWGEYYIDERNNIILLDQSRQREFDNFLLSQGS